MEIAWVEKPEAKRPFERPRHWWEDIRMDLVEVGWEDVDWVRVARVRDQWRSLVNTVIDFWIP